MATYLVDVWEGVYEVEEFNLATIIELVSLASPSVFLDDQRHGQMVHPLVVVECTESLWIPRDHYSYWPC
jgi:hypothetical protein